MLENTPKKEIFSSAELGESQLGSGDPQLGLGDSQLETDDSKIWADDPQSRSGDPQPGPDDPRPSPGGSQSNSGKKFISDAEAVEILRTLNAGVKPCLSRYGYRFVKRTFDLCASAVAIAVLLVFSLVLCGVICVKSPGAGPLYSQWRVGRVRKDGSYRLFRMWKFRSMVPNAHEMLSELQDANEADGPLFKIKEDPRIIPGVGAFIRRHSIDELPQLLNVFVGDMSLIGPRPGLPNEVIQYDEREKGRLAVKPGCGGLWQAGPRSNSSFKEMINLDLEYIERSSAAYDLGLVFKTTKQVIMGKGAF